MPTNNFIPLSATSQLSIEVRSFKKNIRSNLLQVLPRGPRSRIVLHKAQNCHQGACGSSKSSELARESTVKSNVQTERRTALWSLISAPALLPLLGTEQAGASEGYEPMEALKGKDYGKTRMRFEDFTLTESGLQYKEMRLGQGEPVRAGDSVTVDWDGYTIGYYGRPFEARNKSKGGAFTGDDKDFLRFRVGEGKVIPAFEEAIRGMKVGGIRRIVVPVELGYPNNDMNRKEPKPTTFSGRRTLGFVLENQGMMDKTLLFDIELVRVNGKA
uniref:peptidylprolyl isomerase n=1 Tax=Tetraselmis sp. GSL018 TaxID=582737 RepID=A0A061RPL1_9CHLO